MAEYRVPNILGFEWQKSVLDKDLATPPSSPNEGDRYLIASGATDDWSGHDGDITWYENGAWYFIPKKEGMFVYVKDEDKLYYYNGSSWQEFASGNGGSDSDWVIGSGVIYNLNDNVGIGESNPLYKLHIRKDVSSQLDPAIGFFNNSLPDGKWVTMKFGQTLSTNCCGILGFSKDSTNGSRVWLCVEGDDGNRGVGLTVYKGGEVYFGSYSKSTNGYTKLPNGLILQWGEISRGSSDAVIAVTFPITFPNAVLAVLISSDSIGSGTPDGRVSRTRDITVTGFNSVIDSFNSNRCSNYSEKWIAIGY